MWASARCPMTSGNTVVRNMSTIMSGPCMHSALRNSAVNVGAGLMEILRKARRCRGVLSSALNSWTCSRKQAAASPLLVLQLKRYYAEPRNYIQLERDSERDEITVLRMDHKPFNGMNADFMDQMRDTLEQLENSGNCRGVILISANPGIFSGGFDITEIYQKSRDHTTALWRSFQQFWMKLYATNLVTVAAINGHATAGGCLMALSCDYRIMADDKYNIGFTAPRLGIIKPFWVQEIMSKTCGERTTEISFQLGTLYRPSEALSIGLVDEVVPQEKLMDAARTQMVKWLQIPDHARVLIKGMLRMPLIEKLQAQQEDEINYLNNFFHQDIVQKTIGTFLEHLKEKRT